MMNQKKDNMEDSSNDDNLILEDSVSNPTKDQETSTIFDVLSESSKISNELKNKIIGKNAEEEDNPEGNNEDTDALDQDISEIMDDYSESGNITEKIFEDSMKDSFDEETEQSISEQSVSSAATERMTRFLSQEEWEKLQRIQKKLATKDPSKLSLKRKLEQLYDLEVDSETIEGLKKRRKKK